MSERDFAERRYAASTQRSRFLRVLKNHSNTFSKILPVSLFFNITFLAP